MKRIGIDIRCLMQSEYSGVSIYTYNLLIKLFEIDNQNQYILFYNSAQPVKVPDFPFSNVKVVAKKWPNKLLSLSMRFLQYPKLDKLMGGLDILFLPTWQFAAWSKSCPMVLTVHDLSSARYPKFYTRYGRLWHKYLVNPKRLFKKASALIAISNFTKEELVALYKTPAAKIYSVYNGLSEEYKLINDLEKLNKIKAKYNLPEKYIFSLGTIEPRKNIASLLEAVNILRQKNNFSVPLVIAGGKGWASDKVHRAFREQENVFYLGYVAEEDKAALYSQASLFVYPAIYEGFGLPPLEAMACGTPVITSNTSSLPEVVGQAGVLVDPYDVEGMSLAIEEVMNDQSLLDDLGNLGRVQSQKFSWEQCARETLDVFNSSTL